RFFPNTNTPYRNNAQNLSLDISENIVDLQLALGIDLDKNDSILDNGGNNDEWLFNNSGDNAALPTWTTSPLYYLRISTLARTDRYDPQYQAPKIGRIEDHTYPTATGDNTSENRSRRRRIAQSVVKLRNL
ncbi:MAG: PilW family protein, partial [Pseudolysinimonas sp.]